VLKAKLRPAWPIDDWGGSECWVQVLVLEWRRPNYNVGGKATDESRQALRRRNRRRHVTPIWVIRGPSFWYGALPLSSGGRRWRARARAIGCRRRRRRNRRKSGLLDPDLLKWQPIRQRWQPERRRWWSLRRRRPPSRMQSCRCHPRKGGTAVSVTYWSICFRPKFFNTPRLISGRRFRRTWIR
jgi:hypothetical protein